MRRAYPYAAMLLFCFGMPLAGQFTSASLNGVVKDTSGSLVPDAKVTVINTATGFTRADTAAGDEAFLFPVLPVGTYKLTVEKAGFSTYIQESITLTRLPPRRSRCRSDPPTNRSPLPRMPP